MKKRFLMISLILSSVVFIGCGCKYTNSVENNNEESVNKDIKDIFIDVETNIIDEKDNSNIIIEEDTVDTEDTEEKAVKKEDLEKTDTETAEVSSNILVEYSYSNYAWAKTYKGCVIFDDGSIYEFDIDFPIPDEYNFDDTDSFSNYILKYGKKKKTKLLNGDLENLKENVEKYALSNDSFDIDYIGCDMGDTVIKVYYNNEKFLISTSGDANGKSTSDEGEYIYLKAAKYLIH